ncbi:PucR family transcriptional regulator [Paenibacillus crassostreae]|uniref:PucR family transcriptional regulator n=1 Tax=Paenibacillus crassostreae TaxID=1763538 RepID=A0A167B591_9BACL|nr:PucR family transcriptional regulator [Paenibacillus crassostreae]AOZ93159.1 PucR family transcriptional regulator [Paenibacillus crassostreae]OAB71751.1 PucR family transcriptional regulator [Paenibacillus crassostreae]
MHLTVEEALSIYPLSEAKLIAGSKGKHRMIKSINVMDAPDISDWIKEGEMLLTTAYLIKDSLKDASALLQTLNRRGASGLGIKLGRFWDSIPEELIIEAEKLNFPLIELPFQFTFSDQMNGLFRAELIRKTSTMQTEIEKQRKLMQFALRTNRVQPLFDSMSEVMAHPIAVINARGGIIFNNSQFNEAPLLIGWPWLGKSQRVRIGEGVGLRLPLMQGEECIGYLIYFEIDPLMLPVEENLFIQGAELISFHIQSGYEDCLEPDLQREFGSMVKRCLNGGISCTELAQVAAKLEIELLQSPFQLLLTETSTSEKSQQGELLRLKDEYMKHSLQQEMKGIHIVVNEGLLSIYPVDRQNPENLMMVVKECFQKMGLIDGGSPRAAISNRKTEPEGIKEAFEEVKKCLNRPQHWGMNEQVVHYRQLEITLMLQNVPTDMMRKFCDGNLGDLLSREPEYVREMLHTLEVYLDNDGHINETAKKLFIHRNTATYRIEKLSELLDVDLKKINDLLRLRLVFMFRRMLDRE